MRSFPLKILGVTRLEYAGEATWCSIRTPDGSFGLEAGHEDFLAVLESDSLVEYRRPDGDTASLRVRTGLLEFKAGSCRLLVESEG